MAHESDHNFDKQVLLLHQVGLKNLFRIYPNDKLKSMVKWPCTATIVVFSIILMSDTSFLKQILHVIDITFVIIPNLLAFLLAGFAIFMGFGDRSYLIKLTGNGTTLDLFQLIYFGFTITLVAQSLTLGVAFGFSILSDIHFRKLEFMYEYINISGYLVLVFLMSVSLYTIAQVIMNIFGLAQNYHIHLLEKKADELEGRNDCKCSCCPNNSNEAIEKG